MTIDRRKYLWRIKRLEIKSWLKYLMIEGKSVVDYVLGELTSGTEITIDNTVEKKFYKFDVKGNSTQETTTGKNKLNLNRTETSYSTGVTLTETNFYNNLAYDGGVGTSNTQNIIDGSNIKVTSRYGQGAGFPIPCNASEKWTLTATRSDNDGNLCFVYFDENFSYLSNSGNYASDTLTATTPTDCKWLVALFNVKGSTSKQVTFSKVMLEKSASATDFEPYTGGIASPNPSYPQPILSAGNDGSISEKIVNKNLFDKNNFNYIDGKRLNDSGAVVNDADSSYSTTLIKVQPSTTYTIQGTQSISGKSTRLYYYDENQTFLNRSSAYGTDSYSFTTPSNCYYIALQLRNSTYIDLDIIQIELGSTATTYTAHQEQTYTIPCQQPMRSIGAVRDEFIQDTEGNWFERHNIGRVVLNGTENWNMINMANVAGYYISISNIIAPSQSTEAGKGMCNLFTVTAPNINWATSTDNSNFAIINSTTTTAYVRFTKGETTGNLNDWKTWLSTNNVEVIYQLATPTDLPCTSEQISILENLPKSYNEQTNIYSIDTTPAYIEAQAYVKKVEE